ncbi:hypothetical protein AHAS_Ahas03G0165800 [Arachis hypogaea]
MPLTEKIPTEVSSGLAKEKLTMDLTMKKFSIGKESWYKVTSKVKVYNECVKVKIYISFNIEHRLPKIDREHWKKFLEYRAKAETKKNTINRSKQLYTHTGSSKSFARRMEEKESIEEIEQQNESSRVLSQNDFIAQIFGKEKPDRVRGVNFGPTPTQLFGSNSHASGNRVKVEETQRKLFALQAELEGEKLKRKAMEEEATAEKKKMQAMERALIYLFQKQSEELPRDIAVGMSFVE